MLGEQRRGKAFSPFLGELLDPCMPLCRQCCGLLTRTTFCRLPRKASQLVFKQVLAFWLPTAHTMGGIASCMLAENPRPMMTTTK